MRYVRIFLAVVCFANNFFFSAQGTRIPAQEDQQTFLDRLLSNYKIETGSVTTESQLIVPPGYGDFLYIRCPVSSNRAVRAFKNLAAAVSGSSANPITAVDGKITEDDAVTIFKVPKDGQYHEIRRLSGDKIGGFLGRYENEANVTIEVRRTTTEPTVFIRVKRLILEIKPL